MKLYLIRHAQSQNNAGGNVRLRYTNRIDHLPLALVT